MNFQPTDYLSDLNLEFDGSNMSPIEEVNSSDLDLFTQTEFFDLDVFSNDLPLQVKEQRPSQELQFLPQSVKSEASDHLAAASIVSDSHNVEFTDISVSQDDLLHAASNGNGNLPTEDLNEIKRKRNTAASARFRIKKKLKEKQMEQQASELRDRLSLLEKKLKTLEMENKCLKQLLIEKNEKKNSDLLDSIKKRSLDTTI